MQMRELGISVSGTEKNKLATIEFVPDCLNDVRKNDVRKSGFAHLKLPEASH